MAAHQSRFLISLDYGTTYTGAAWAVTTGRPITLADINVVTRWPGGGNEPKVPSLFTYSPNSGNNWGAGIGDNAYLIRLTKLRLEPPTKLDALASLRGLLSDTTKVEIGSRNVIRRQIPRHLLKTSADVMVDYLTEVAARIRMDIESRRDPHLLTVCPIDLVITHPGEWHHRARNTTFRAAVEAFETVFPEFEQRPGTIRLATEPEACAQYTMSVAREQGIRDLRQGQCFIVVDAGGGTVDLVSYRVDELDPNFRVTRVTEVSSDTCGSSYVDNYFRNQFLLKRLGPVDHAKLTAASGGYEQHGSGAHTVWRSSELPMMEKFQNIKHQFKGRAHADDEPQADFIDLPEGIGEQDSDENNIHNGQLQITCEDMEEMFRRPVLGTIRLIEQQLGLIEAQGLKVRTIFLSGGFSQSDYLHSTINNLARRRRFHLVRGDDSWTAVAKGAVLKGLGVHCDIPTECIKCPYHIGVVLSQRFTDFDHHPEQRYTDSFDNSERARDNIKWMVAKGDLITVEEGIDKQLKLVRKITSRGNQVGTVTIVTSDADKPAGVFLQQQGVGALGPRPPVNLNYDLSRVPEDQKRLWRRGETAQGTAYYQVEMQLEISVSQARLRVDLLCGKVQNMLGNTVEMKEGYQLATQEISL